MSNIYTNQSNKKNKLIKKCLIMALLTSYLVGVQPSEAGFGSNNIPSVESIYIFTQEQSSLTQTGGSSSISQTYSIYGRFNFYADIFFNSAYFSFSNATLAETSPYLLTQDLASIFNFFGLTVSSTTGDTIILNGTTNDGTNSDIVLTMTFNGDNLFLQGQITPPLSNGYYYTLSAVAVRKYGGGTGFSFNPYLISTANHMNTIGLHPEDWQSSFKLTQNISLLSYKNKDFNIIGYYNNNSDNKPFGGTFYGNNKAIRNFTYSASSVNRIGLFGYINGNNAAIKDLGVIDPNIQTSDGEYIGALVGHLSNGSISNCYVKSGTISGMSSVGGLIGRNGSNVPVTDINEEQPCTAGTIMNCVSDAIVKGTAKIGGLAGSNDGIITDCNVTAKVTGYTEIGGFAGFNGGVILDCNSSAQVSGNRKIGAMVGNNYGIICGGISEGTVFGQENVGGIAGYNNGGYIKYCFSDGVVDGNSTVGGLAGTNGGNIYSSYSSGTVTGDLYVGGCIGKNFWQISSCFSIADVNVRYGYAGGLSGTNESTGMILDCYSSGSVSGRIYIGGLLGRNDGVVMKCYATGLVTDNYSLDNESIGFGGLIGDSNDMSTAFLSYWDTQTSGQASSAGGIGKTTAQMKDIATFNNWGKCSDETDWTIYQDKNDSKNNDYPRLLWEGADGNSIEPVRLADLLLGSGSEDDPYLVFTSSELNEIGLFPCEWDKYFLLSADIDMSQNADGQFNVIGFYRLPFTGVFDGNDYTISNLEFNSEQQSYVGLFGCIGSLIAQVKDLGLINPVINAKDDIGSLTGFLKEGSIANCYAQNADVNGCNSVGGLIGNNQAAVMDCYLTGNVNGYTNVGGLSGINWRGAIESCYSVVNVSGESLVGGLIGDNSGSIIESYSNSSISANSLAGGLTGSNSGSIEDANSTGNVSGYEKIGGLTGSNNGELTSCYSTSNVNGDYLVGGLTGYNVDGTILSCYAIGSVYGRLSAGGLAGQNSGKASISKCYAMNSVSGNESVGGLAGTNESSISQCYSSGTVSGSLEIGGLVGWNYSPGSITNSYSQSNVLAGQYAGGLVGVNSGSISISYSSGNVAGTTMTVGGLAALNFTTISASFWDIETSGQSSSSGGTGKTTANMKKRATFTSAGWDFVGENANGTQDIWRINENQDYPRLNWQQ